MLAGLGGSVAF